MKVKIEWIEKVQTRGKLDMKKYRNLNGNTKGNTNRLKEMDERISGNEDMQKKQICQPKKTLNLKTYKNPGTKCPEDLGYNKNSKHMNSRNKGRRQTYVKDKENIFN